MGVTADSTEGKLDVQWISARVAEAWKSHTSITDAVSARIQELLSGQLSERQLTSREFSSLAAELIADMTPDPTDPVATQ